MREGVGGQHGCRPGAAGAQVVHVHGNAHAELRAPAGLHVLRMPESAPGIRTASWQPPAPARSGSASRERFPYLAVLGVPDALRHHLEEGPDRLGVAHGEVAEAVFGEHQAVQLGLSGDRRRTVTVGFVN